MSPTIFRHKQFKFFFFSREESRMHVHVLSPDGEAKFWLEPAVALAKHHNLKAKALKRSKKLFGSVTMKSARPGKSISEVEVQGISKFGVWLYVQGQEYFLPYEEYPRFREAKVSDVMNVRLVNEHHLEWPELDVDLEVESLEHPEKYPLKFSKK